MTEQELLTARVIGTDPARAEGADKVRGRVPYAYEHPVEDPLYLFPVQAEIARGRAPRSTPTRRRRSRGCSSS